MGRLRTVRNGVPLVTAPSPLLDLLCLAALNTGIPFLGALPVTLTLTLAWSHQEAGRLDSISRDVKPADSGLIIEIPFGVENITPASMVWRMWGLCRLWGG